MKKDKIIGILKTDRLPLKENFGVEVIVLFVCKTHRKS
jgi:hypothetical protein